MREYNHNARITTATLLALLLGAYLYSADTSAEGAVREISRVNGHIEVERGEQVANVSTVNGSIEIAGDASAARVSTVNGGIDIGQASRIERAETVNGDITLAADTQVQDQLTTVNGGIRVGPNAVVAGPVSSVNGSIRFAEGTRVDGDVRTANGDIRLLQTHVSRDLVTRNGDITLSQGSRVEGDIIVQRRRGWWEGFALFGHRHQPHLRIDETSSVAGDIHLYREVTIDIADGAETGEIIRHY